MIQDIAKLFLHSLTRSLIHSLTYVPSLLVAEIFKAHRAKNCFGFHLILEPKELKNFWGSFLIKRSKSATEDYQLEIHSSELIAPANLKMLASYGLSLCQGIFSIYLQLQVINH